MYLGIGILCVVLVPGTFGLEDIHEYMTPEERRHVFRRDDGPVPEYEVVRLHMSRLHKRGVASGMRLHTKAFGRDINLWLHPTDSLLAGVDTPVYSATYSPSAPQGVEFRERHGLMRMVGKMYENEDKKASVVIGTEETGRTRVNGYIESDRIVVRSLPQRVVEEYSRRRRSPDEPEDPQDSPYHVIIKMQDSLENDHSLSPINETRLRERIARSADQVPDVLYPEVLVVVENSVYSCFFYSEDRHDIYALLEYILAFWNSVDLKFRSLESPRFRIHISAIVLGEAPEGTPYISNNMLNTQTFNSWKALVAAKLFFYGVKDTFPLTTYDIPATMTTHKFGIESQVVGQAWVNTSCKVDDAAKTVEAVTIHQDNCEFGGVRIIAHEIGHILGAEHDASEECPSKQGFLMTGATLPVTINSSDFSNCSVQAFQTLLDNNELTCLYNQPPMNGEQLPKPMPGRIKKLEAQCKYHGKGNGKSCQDQYPEHSVCVNMFCINEDGRCVNTRKAALDGTECGDNKFCLHQQCVSLSD